MFTKLLLFTFLSLSISHSAVLTTDNHLSIVGPIDDDLVNRAIEKSAFLNKHNNYTYIYINSPGGSVLAGQRYINLINNLKSSRKIMCICDVAASMAFHILQHCDYRYVLETSRMMQHQISLSGIEGNIKNIKSYITMIEEMYDSMIIIESKRLQISKELYEKKIESDWWIYGGEKLVKDGFADLMLKSISCSKELIKKKTFVTNILDNILIKKSACPLII